MNYLLDTNVISELCKRRTKIDPGVLEWVSDTPSEALFTSVLVVGELAQGVLRLRRRDVKQADAVQARLDQLSLYTRNALVVDLAVVKCWAILNSPDPKPVIDSLLAATALAHQLTVVTRNERDFRNAGVPVINPFQDSGRAD